MAEGWSEGLKVGWERRLLIGSRPWRGAGAWQKGCANGHVFGARKALFGVGRNDIILETGYAVDSTDRNILMSSPYY